MNRDLQDEQIRAYLKGRLSAEERTELEYRLQQDHELAERLALQRAEIAAAELLIAEDTRTMFRQWQQEKGRPGFPKTGWLLFLASAIVVAVGLFWFRNAEEDLPDKLPVEMDTKPIPAPLEQPPPPAAALPKQPQIRKRRPETSDYSALAQAYFQEPVIRTMRTVADTVYSPYRLAQEAYSLGEYQKVLDLLTQVDSTRRQAATFLSANALFHLKRYPEAESQFQQLVDTNSRQYRYQSEWGMLTCRLALLPDGKKNFEALLDGILANPDHPYAEQAKLLRKTLNE